MIWKLFDGDVPHVSTFAFHEHRPRAPHLEQDLHRPRLLAAAGLVRAAVRMSGGGTVTDLGCGDGGLLQLLGGEIRAWGYDFCPANAAGWAERGVEAEALDVFGADRARVRLGDVVVLTEVLEHIADPVGVLRWVHGSAASHLVCSSPWDETPNWHDECHAWAMDWQGYRDLVTMAGWRILRHDKVDRFQLILAAKL
jgi:SAM-dependent methyltransferase